MRQGFASFDPLSALVGALLFEDVIGVFLPLPRKLCTFAGCGHLSRALLFEREWIRRFPAMAEPLVVPPCVPGGRCNDTNQRVPELVLGSTWVETGNRTLAASLPVDAERFPGAMSLTRCLRRQPSLISAAHTSARFPYISPLAAIVPAVVDGASDPACPHGGHLIDGGYFDNSGVVAVADAMRLVRSALAGQDRQVQVILIRNGQDNPACLAGRRDGPDPHCIVPTDEVLTDPAQLSVAGQRRKLTAYPDQLGPLLSLINVSGVGSHGRLPPGQIRAALGNPAGPCGRSVLRTFDQVNDGSLIPLGWYLSGAAQRALQVQAARLIQADAKPVSINCKQ